MARPHKQKLTKAQQALVVDAMWVPKVLARKVYSKHTTGTLALGDLESHGYIALCSCATRFDPGKGVRFSTYAYVRVRGAILNAIRDTARTVRLPRTILNLRPQVKRLIQEGLSYGEVARELGITIGQVAEAEASWREESLPLDTHDDEKAPVQLTQEGGTYHELQQEHRDWAEGLSDGDLALLRDWADGKPMTDRGRVRIEELAEGNIELKVFRK